MRILLILLLCAPALATSCDDTACETSKDCFRGELCTAQGKCREPSADMDGSDMRTADMPGGSDMSPADMPRDMLPDLQLDMPDIEPDMPDAPPDMLDMPDAPTDMPGDPCAGITCSGHGTCTSSAGAPRCSCDSGYVNAPNAACAPAPAALLVEAGAQHTCAIKAGALSCWGDNANTQIDGGAAIARTPRPIASMGSGVSHVALGSRHTCAIRAGALFCWGDNNQGQLGINTTTSATLPTAVIDMERDVEAVAAGDRHTCAVKAGALYCWGDNNQGQLGTGNSTMHAAPVAITEMSADITHVAAGARHTCALKAGALLCWGDHSQGQLGIGPGSSMLSPTALSLNQNVSAVAAGETQTCAIQQGALHCWGTNTHISLEADSPKQIATLGTTVTAVTVGSTHLCAIANTNRLYCWGDNSSKQIRDTPCNQANTNCFNPTLPTSLGAGSAAYTTVGAQHSCAVYASQIRCWGDNARGQTTGENNPTSPPNTITLP